MRSEADGAGDELGIGAVLSEEGTWGLPGSAEEVIWLELGMALFDGREQLREAFYRQEAAAIVASTIVSETDVM